MGDFHPAVEEYLETIYELEEAGIVPMRARIVERLGVSAPSVSETVKRLEREGYLTLDASKAMVLTESGRKYATDMVRRHRLAERLLVDVLNVPWHQVHEEACRLEHAISDNLERHLVALLDDPGTCPHGNPIPGSKHSAPLSGTIPMRSLAEGTEAEVRRIDEQLEADPAGLLLLEESDLTPGSTFTVLGHGGGTVSLTTSTGVVEVPEAVAALVYVAG
ncbi:MAG: DtxR family transcriptional regulator, Mn-dependent transcriptional regulator [Frankiaceae bacterium]|jgi:DtxR family Mn-dependent transcriptional regulator|nr:DtxR family transcriptional regulator, Mn-dependent transcriptional regulator [Frankiaceae bacterium]